MTLLRHFPYSEDTAAGNMARDAVMLGQCLRSDAILWRFYGWSEAAITFGYSQKWDWVQTETQDFEGVRIRRWTGGGIVDHRNDLTYCIAIPESHPFHRQPALEFYRQLHDLLAKIFQGKGMDAELQPCPGKCEGSRKTPGGICFQSAEPYDVVAGRGGSKLAGAAMKRNTNGILVQGSICLPDNSLEMRRHTIHAFGDMLPDWLNTGPSRQSPELPDERLQEELKRFASCEWNRKR